MMPKERNDIAKLAEDQYQPGSEGTVLSNLPGIATRGEMEIAETTELWRAAEELCRRVAQDQSFTAEDICGMHRLWLGKLYRWAGQYRQVNISRDGFDFAMARVIPKVMAEFEREQLRRYTPCLAPNRDEIAHALAEVHVELMLIHPFREGNGRLGRLLATLMALQAGLPPLDFSDLAGSRREEYLAAVRAGLDRDYRPMQELFAAVIERS